MVMKYFHGDAIPALLCNKEPSQGTQNHQLGAFSTLLGRTGLTILACREIVIIWTARHSPRNVRGSQFNMIL